MWEQVTTWCDQHREDAGPCLMRRCKGGRKAGEVVTGVCAWLGAGLAGPRKGHTESS